MSKAIHIHVADSLDAIGARVVEAWRRGENCELTGTNAEIHIGFESWEALVRTLSPKGWNCCGIFTARPPGASARSPLALGRDYRRVHEDVEALEAAGLLDRE